ncbi:MAG: hypothetical protein FWC73_08345 [Defluviitaleaceae bacterium]|nr:hypothetical protein [Defluviitaleaceae bacterium]
MNTFAKGHRWLRVVLMFFVLSIVMVIFVFASDDYERYLPYHSEVYYGEYNSYIVEAYEKYYYEYSGYITYIPYYQYIDYDNSYEYERYRDYYYYLDYYEWEAQGDGGYIGIAPLLIVQVDSWADLRDAVDDAATSGIATTIELTVDIFLPNATGTNQAITIPATADITLTSDQERRMVQRTAGTTANNNFPEVQILWRHFLVDGILRLENIILCGQDSLPTAIRGGIEVNAGGSLYMETGSILRNNRHRYTHQGGAVTVRGAGASFTMNGGEISNNRVIAGYTAGGVLVIAGATFIMNGGSITNNHLTTEAGEPAGNSAGGVAVQGYSGVASPASTFYMYGGIISYNIGRFGGGAIVGRPLTGASSLTPGSALPRIYIFGGEMYENRGLFGGGVNIERGILIMDYGTATDGTTTYGVIHNNTATGLAGTPGGPGLAANRGGGGVFLQNGGRFDMYAGEIHTNRSNNHGGGVMLIHAQDVFNMRGGIIRNNVSHGVNANNVVSTGLGGGVYVMNGTFNMTDVPGTTRTRIIENNHARYGGGVYVGGTTVNSIFNMGGDSRIIGNGYIHQPVVVGWNSTGHGVRVSNGTFNMHGGLISGNTRLVGAPGNSNGGGVHLTGGRFTGTVANNNVVSHPSRFYMHGGNISGHIVTQNGSGVHVSASTFVLSGIVFNHASPIFTMTGGTIGGDPEEDEGNFAAGNGGGIYLRGGTFIQTGSTVGILGNEAGQHGGGIYVCEYGHLTANGAHITNNIAPNGMGGGVFSERHDYNSPLIRVSPAYTGDQIAYSNLSLVNVTFAENRASRRYVPPSNALTHMPHLGFATTSQLTYPVPVRVHLLNNYDINFRVSPVLFEFFKTNQQLYANPPMAVLLPNARFRVFRADASGLSIGGDGLVQVDIANQPNSPWQEVNMTENVSPGVATMDPLGFYMTPGFIYQLVEYQAPSGFQLPMGQWQIINDPTDSTIILFKDIGGVIIPPFILNNFSPIDIDWFLGNWVDFELPMSGGAGSVSVLLTFAGLAFVSLGGVLMFFIRTRKKRI